MMWCKWLEYLHTLVISAFPPHVTLYDETKVHFGCGYLDTAPEV